MGQLRYIGEVLLNEQRDYSRIHQLIEILDRYSSLVTGMDRGFHSINSDVIPDEARQAYDLHQVIRHKLSASAPIWSIARDTPRQTSHYQDLPEVIDKRDVLK